MSELTDWTRALVSASHLLDVWTKSSVVVIGASLLVELCDRLDQAEADLDHYVALHESAQRTLEAVKDRLDDFTYDELAGDLADGAMDEFGDEYQSRLSKAEAAIARVREAHREHKCSSAEFAPDCFIVHGGHCSLVGHCACCGYPLPCPTIRALDGE